MPNRAWRFKRLHVGNRRHRRQPGAAIAIGMLLACNGCVDSYPGEDAVNIRHDEMTQTQRIEAMNQLGAQVGPHGRWHYELLPECTLQVRYSGKPRLSLKMSMLDASTGLDFDKEEETFEVRVRPQQGLNRPEVPVLSSPRWTDAVVMQSLLDHVQRGCSPSVPAPEPRLMPAAQSGDALPSASDAAR